MAGGGSRGIVVALVVAWAWTGEQRLAQARPQMWEMDGSTYEPHSWRILDEMSREGEARWVHGTARDEKGPRVDGAKAGFEWFEGQKLDHFEMDALGRQTWRQRFVRGDDSRYQPGGAVFLYISGEGDLSPAAVDSSKNQYAYWAENDYGGVAIALEHRFYGASQPFGNSSFRTEHLKYLSAEQGLADLAFFVDSHVRRVLYPDAGQVVVVGGSYAGAMSAWARLRYPHIFQGSLSSSGPVNAVFDFEGYYRIVREAIGEACYNNIKHTIDVIGKLVGGNETGRAYIESTFHTCSPIAAHESEKDVVQLFSTIADTFAGLVQYNNRPGRSYSKACELLDKSAADDDKLLNAVATVVLSKDYGSKVNCSESSYSAALDKLRGKNSNPRSWTWQTCTEFGFFQADEGFGIPIDFFKGMCADLFGQSISEYPDTAGTNMIYGGPRIAETATNTFFTNGEVDPWHLLGVLKVEEVTGYNRFARFMKSTAHCAEMFRPKASDPLELNTTRVMQKLALDLWLGLEANATVFPYWYFTLNVILSAAMVCFWLFQTYPRILKDGVHYVASEKRPVVKEPAMQRSRV